MVNDKFFYKELVNEKVQTNNAHNSIEKVQKTKCKMKKDNSVNSTFEEVQNDIQKYNVDLDNSDGGQGPKVRRIEVEETRKVAKCSIADATLQEANKHIQSVAKMVSNIQEEAATSQVHREGGINKSITNSAIEKPRPKLDQIKKRKRTSLEKLKDRFIVKIKKTKLTGNILGQLGKNADDSSRGASNSHSLSKESPDQDTSCRYSTNISDKNEKHYLDNINVKKRKHFADFDRRNPHSEYSQIEDQNAEYTQDEDDDKQAVQVTKKKKKVRRSKQMAQSTVQEIDTEKNKRLSTIDQTIDDVIKKYSALSEKSSKDQKNNVYEPVVITSNMFIVKDTEEARTAGNRASNIERTRNSEVERYSGENIIEVHNNKNGTRMPKGKRKSSTKIPVVCLDNIFSNKDFVQKYNLSKYLKQRTSTKKHSISTKKHSTSTKKHSTSTNKHKSNNKPCSSATPNSPMNCLVSSNYVSPPLNNSTPSTSVNPVEPSATPNTVPTCELSSKNNNSNYGNSTFTNIQITRDVANNTIVRCVPIPNNRDLPMNKMCENNENTENTTAQLQSASHNRDLPMNKMCENTNAQLQSASNRDLPMITLFENTSAQVHSASVSAVNSFCNNDSFELPSEEYTNISNNFEDSFSNYASGYNWTEIYEFSVNETTKVESYDSIFKDAAFYFESDGDASNEDVNLRSEPVKKLSLPLIVRTVDNNYANTKMAGCSINPSFTSVKLNSSTAEQLDEKNSSKDHHSVYNESDTSRGQTPVGSEISLHDASIETNSNSGSVATHSSICMSPRNFNLSDESHQTSAMKHTRTVTTPHKSNKSGFNGSRRVSLISKSSSPVPNLKLTVVTQNADKKFSTNSGQSCDVSESNSIPDCVSPNLQFKLPSLPPAKRPPTRIKGTAPLFKPIVIKNVQCTLSTPKMQTKTSSTLDIDDAVSICASSIISKTNFEEELAADDVVDGIENSTSFKEAEVLEMPVLVTRPANIATPLPVVDGELEVNCSPTRSVSSANSNELQNDIKKWLEKNQRATNHLQCEVSETPSVFENICYFHFYKNKCTRRYSCSRRLHDREVLGSAIKNLSRDQLIKAYVYAKGYGGLYRLTFDYFLSAFEKLKCTNILMQIVDDILRTEIYNKTPYIAKIISSLCNIGVPFFDVIGEILMCGDNDKRVCLSDILLDIVCIYHKTDLYKNWCIVQELIKHRVEPVDRGLVEEIMITCSQSKRVKLAVNIVQDFIIPGVVDLKSINIHTLHNFLFLLQSHNLEEGERLIAQMESNEILVMPPDISKQTLVSAEDGNGKPNEMPTVSNKSNLIEASEQESLLLNDNARLISNSVAVVSKSNSYSKASGENNDTVTGSNFCYDDELDLDFEDDLENDAGVITNPKDLCNSSNQNTGIEHVTNAASHNDVEIDLGYDKFYSHDNNSPSRSFSDISSEMLQNSLSSDENFELDVNRGSSNSHDVAPCRSAASVVSSTKSQYTENLNEIDNLESRGNNESEFNLTANLSPSSSMNCIPVHTLNDNEVLENTDLLLLKDATDRGNNLEYFVMLCKFKGTTLKHAFVLNTLACYKETPPAKIYEMLYPMITSIAHLEPTLQNDVDLLSMLNTLSVNTLGHLEHHKAYIMASNILLQFRGKYEKLCNATWFVGPHRHGYSEIGKYLYFCKILVKGNRLKEAWDILTSSELKLLHGINKWTLKHFDCFDNKLRNFILEDLITTALDIDIQFAKRVILCIINHNSIVTEIDIWKLFNRLLLTMMDSNNYVKDLISMIENIIEGWYKYLFPSVLRGLLVRLAIKLPENDALELYDKCCRRKCYQYIKGDEKILYLTTNMFEVEIYMTLHVYMYKKVRNQFPLTNISIMIKLPDPALEQLNLNEFNSHGSQKKLKLKIANVLSKALAFTVCIDYSYTKQPYIGIQAQQLQRIFNYYQKLQQHPTHYRFWNWFEQNIPALGCNEDC